MLLDAVNVTVRTITFTILVVRDPESAVVAFSVAQILAVVSYVVSYYVYFHNYMKKRQNSIPQSPDDFPFRKITDFLPQLTVGQVR